MKKTVLAWIAAICFLLAYEVYALANATPGDTLSEAVWEYGQHPMIWLAVGILLGHFAWQRRGNAKR